jgi:uncharacterized membrane protein (UPF0127 family)
MRSILIPLAATAIFIAVVGIFSQRFELRNFKPFNPPVEKASIEKSEVKIGSAVVSVFIADTEEARIKGLSSEGHLDENAGMLFVFDQKDVFPSFWMKNMSLAIDIIWINDAKVVAIDKGVQPPTAGTADSQLKLYRPDKPVDYVLEVNAGFSDRHDIKVGDSISM